MPHHLLNDPRGNSCLIGQRRQLASERVEVEEPEAVSYGMPAASRSARSILAPFSGRGKTGVPGASVATTGLRSVTRSLGNGSSAVWPFLV
jgi:hypothetical protein